MDHTYYQIVLCLSQVEGEGGGHCWCITAVCHVQREKYHVTFMQSGKLCKQWINVELSSNGVIINILSLINI